MSLDVHAFVVLDGFTLDVALSVEAGQTVAVVGPNGAGKTTLLRALAGLRALTAGCITLDGAVLDNPDTGTYLTPERRPVGVVFQDHLLFPHLDVLGNVAFGPRSRGHRKNRAEDVARAWLERVGLADRAAARPRELSGGQAQRVAVARALAGDPQLLLLDEPLAALDVHTRSEVRRDLLRYLASFPGVRLLVTHDPLDAAVLADTIVVLENGRVVQTGTPAEITARPRTPWVAQLIGTNLYRGKLDANALSLDDGTVLTVVSQQRGPVFATISPRAVVVHREPPEGSARNVWTGTVAAVEPVGDRCRLTLDAQPPITAEVSLTAVTALGLTPGTAIWVAVKATEIEVYPA
ncbi:MAG: ABC transporter ATP-binding protein [Acidimicrobiales bacterium]